MNHDDRCIECLHIKKERGAYYCTDANHPTPATIFPDKYGCIYFTRIDSECIKNEIEQIWNRLEVMSDMLNKLWADSKHS